MNYQFTSLTTKPLCDTLITLNVDELDKRDLRKLSIERQMANSSEEASDIPLDIAAAQAGWEKAKELIRDPKVRLVLLDEINIALRYEYLDLPDILKFLHEEKPASTHVVLTGRNAAEALIEAADLVTEMTLIKHPFRSGIKAQAGVEF